MINFSEDEETCVEEWQIFCELRLQEAVKEMSTAAAARGIPFQDGIKTMAAWMNQSSLQLFNSASEKFADDVRKDVTLEEMARVESNLNIRIQRHKVEFEMMGHDDAFTTTEENS